MCSPRCRAVSEGRIIILKSRYTIEEAGSDLLAGARGSQVRRIGMKICRYDMVLRVYFEHLLALYSTFLSCWGLMEIFCHQGLFYCDFF